MVLEAGQTMADLRASFHQPGRIEWIGLRKTVRGSMLSVNHAIVEADRGLPGDHKSNRSGGTRQITLVQHEHLDVIAKLCGLPVVDPGMLRRNIVVSGLNLLALRDWRFQLGSALLAGSGACHPCSRMQENLGPGGYNAVRGHGGITAVILASGAITVGDSLVPLAPNADFHFP